jgi:hypothetical protein
MSQELVKIEHGELLSSGLMLGVHEKSVPLWARGENIEFHQGDVHKARGWTVPTMPVELFDSGSGNFDAAPGLFDGGAGGAALDLSAASTAIRGAHSHKTIAGAREHFFGTVSDIYLWQGGSTTAVGTGYNGLEDETEVDPATVWSFAKFGDWTIATNGIDPIQIYKGTSFDDLGGSPPATAQIVRTLGPHLLALNTDDGDTPVEFTKEDDVEAWDPVANVTAGDLPLREAGSEIIAAENLGGRLALYGTNEMHIVSYIRSPFVFGSRHAMFGVGAFSKQAIVPVEGRHFGWGPVGIFRTDGVSAQYLDTPTMRHWIQQKLNVSQKSKIFGFQNFAQQRVVWFAPFDGNDEPSKGIGFDYVTGNVTIYAYGRTSGVPRGVLNYPILTTADGNAYMHEIGVDANGVPLVASLISKPMDGGDPRQWKYVDALQVALKEIAGTGVRVALGFQDKLGDDESDEELITWTEGFFDEEGFQLDFVRQEGVFLRFKISTSDLGDDFILSGFDILGEYDGATF